MESGSGAKHERQSCGQRTGNTRERAATHTTQVYAWVYAGVDADADAAIGVQWYGCVRVQHMHEAKR